jgi:hypothetical protein
VHHANKLRYSTVDVSITVGAVHLQGTEAYAASHKKVGSAFNVKLVGRFDFTQGLPSCARWRTEREDDGLVGLYRVTRLGFCGRGHWHRRTDGWKDLVASTETRKEELGVFEASPSTKR